MRLAACIYCMYVLNSGELAAPPTRCIGATVAQPFHTGKVYRFESCMHYLWYHNFMEDMMPLKDPEQRRAYHQKYMREVWYPANAERHKAYVKRNKIDRRNWFRELKLAFVCQICGEQDAVCLDFHHRDPTEKDISVGDAASRGWSKERVLAEMAKCDVLCANCHRKHHYNAGK